MDDPFILEMASKSKEEQLSSLPRTNATLDTISNKTVSKTTSSKTEETEEAKQQQQCLSLSKKERGRLKKFRKRIVDIKFGSKTSGLATLEEWNEWNSLEQKNDRIVESQHLNNDANDETNDENKKNNKNNNNNNNNNSISILDAPTPPCHCCIRLYKQQKQKHKHKEQQQQTEQQEEQHGEGVDHRFLLFHLVCQILESNKNLKNNILNVPNSKNKKRNYQQMKTGNNNDNNENNNASDDKNVSALELGIIPSWALVHNPMALRRLMIVELQVATKEELQIIVSNIKQLQKQRQINNNVLSSSSSSSCHQESHLEYNVRHVFLPVDTQWFQGPHIKSISDLLLHCPTTFSKSGYRQKNRSSSSSSLRSINKGYRGNVFELLKPLIANTRQMKQEGYPRCLSSVTDDETIIPSEQQREIQKESSIAKPNNIEEHETKINNNIQNLPTLQEAHALIQNHLIRVAVPSKHKKQRLQQQNQQDKQNQATTSESTCDNNSLMDSLSDTDPKSPATGNVSSTTETTTNHVGDAASRSNPNSSPSSSVYISTPLFQTDKNAAVAKESPPRVFALDCEMVLTEVGPELARVTMIELLSVNTPPQNNGGGMKPKMETRVILNALVKPCRPILDYMTLYSGLTAAHLNNVTTRLSQVQAFMISNVSNRDILIGHSLENDLHALEWIHPTVVDTALVFSSSLKRSKKYSLRHLSASLLRRKIQQDRIDNKGHCSEEDARASLELAIRRALLGPSFGIFSEESFTDHEQMAHLLSLSNTPPESKIKPDEEDDEMEKQ